MAVGSGLGATLGSGIESTWGTGVAPTKWLEIESETIAETFNRTDGKGLYGGIGVPRGTNHVTTTGTVGGTVKAPVYFKGMGQWLGSLMGSLTTTPVQQGGSIAYLQTHALNLNTLGQSLSIQKGVPDLTGTLRPYTAIGSKVTQAQFDISVDGFAECTWTVDAKDLVESTQVVPGAPTISYTVPSYLTQNPPFAWGEGVVSMGSFGSETAIAGIRKLSLTVKRAYNQKRFYIDGTGRKAEQVSNGFIEISGSLDTDFIDKTKFVDLYANNGNVSMIVTFTGPAPIASTYYPTISFALPQVFFTGESPKIGGPELIQPSIPFKALYDDTHTPMTIAYMSTDTSL